MSWCTTEDCLHCRALLPQGKKALNEKKILNISFIYIFFIHFQLNKRKNITITYNTSLPVIFGVKHYADALWKVVEKRDIKVNLRRNLIEVRPQEDIAVFQDLDKPEQVFEEKVRKLLTNISLIIITILLFSSMLCCMSHPR